MRDISRVVKPLTTSWRGDVLLAVALTAWAVAYQGVAGAHGSQHWVVLIFASVYATALAVRRPFPVIAAAATCAALVAVSLLGADHAIDSSLAIFSWTPFLLAYSLGAGAGLIPGLAVTALLATALLVESRSFNPFLIVITAGPWLAARIIRARRRIAEQLEARNRELEAQRELFTRESVRYERARIARELHDIVAHFVTVIVVQASAGQRLPDTDRSGAAEALDSIAEAAMQAQTEIGTLAWLLGGEPQLDGPPRLQAVAELARRAGATGPAVNCRFLGACDRLAPATSEAGYRVVQEALTNAIKHAPGAPVDVCIRDADGGVQVDIVNEAPREQPSGLERSGARHDASADGRLRGSARRRPN